MQIESLKLFCDLSETGSFTKTAQINQITQSAVSQQMGALERHFKTLLIERSKKRFRLTDEGRLLYDYSKQIIQTYDSLNNELQEMKQIVSGTIRLSTIYSFGLHELPPYIKAYLQQHPAVNVHVEYRRSNQVYDDVMGNLVDLGLVAYPSNESKVEVQSICNDRLVVICHPNRVRQGKSSVALSEIQGERFIGFDPDIPTRKGIDRILREHDIGVSVVMEFDNIETVKRAVEIDAGISIVPQSTVVQEVAMKTLIQLEIEDGTFYRPLAVIYRKNKVLSPAMKEFVEILKSV